MVHYRIAFEEAGAAAEDTHTENKYTASYPRSRGLLRKASHLSAIPSDKFASNTRTHTQYKKNSQTTVPTAMRTATSSFDTIFRFFSLAQNTRIRRRTPAIFSTYVYSAADPAPPHLSRQLVLPQFRDSYPQCEHQHNRYRETHTHVSTTAVDSDNSAGTHPHTFSPLSTATCP